MGKVAPDRTRIRGASGRVRVGNAKLVRYGFG